MFAAAFGESGAPAGLPPLEIESESRASVTRRDLWRIVDAAKAFHRRATSGRLDADAFHRSREALEAAFERLPDGAWAKP